MLDGSRRSVTGDAHRDRAGSRAKGRGWSTSPAPRRLMPLSRSAAGLDFAKSSSTSVRGSGSQRPSMSAPSTCSSGHKSAPTPSTTNCSRPGGLMDAMWRSGQDHFHLLPIRSDARGPPWRARGLGEGQRPSSSPTRCSVPAPTATATSSTSARQSPVVRRGPDSPRRRPAGDVVLGSRPSRRSDSDQRPDMPCSVYLLGRRQVAVAAIVDLPATTSGDDLKALREARPRPVASGIFHAVGSRQGRLLEAFWHLGSAVLPSSTGRRPGSRSTQPPTGVDRRREPGRATRRWPRSVR